VTGFHEPALAAIAILTDADRMRAEARVLGQALLDHHREITARKPPGKRILTTLYTIRYGVLCDRAKLAHLVRMVGPFLSEVAEWCAAAGYPPLHSLAVGESQMPGVGYNGAGGFTTANWPADVERCIRFTEYPPTMPPASEDLV
jgi:hypothetical protein